MEARAGVLSEEAGDMQAIVRLIEVLRQRVHDRTRVTAGTRCYTLT